MSTRPWARGALALAATIALALTGLVAPASAAGTATINGKLTAPYPLLVEGWVDLFAWNEARGRWEYVDDTSTGADGAFSFTGVEAGREYTFRFEGEGTPGEGFAPGQALGGVRYHRYTKSKSFTARSGTQSIAFPLSGGVEVKGKVVLPAGVTGPVRLDLYTIYADRYGGLDVDYGADWVDSVEALPNGTFTFPHVIPGTRYSVAVQGTEEIEPVSTNPPYLGDSTRSMRLITGPTTLPTMTLQHSVPVSGRVSYLGAPPAGAVVRLYEVDPSGAVWSMLTTTVAADGSFTFPAGAFPGRRYTVSVWHESHMTFPGAATFVWDALTFRAGTSGLVIPDFALNVQSGPDRTPSVELDSVVLRGTPTVGSTLSVRNAGGRLGGASRTPGATVSYQWLRGGEFIPGATGPQYTLTEEDLHHFVGARITVRAPGHVTDSDDTGWVFVETGGAPYATSFPVVSGSAKVGGKLSVSRGSWSVPSVGLAYQWLRDGQPVVGATGASYVLKAADRGRRLSVRITASAPGRADGVSVTAPSAKVAKGDAAKVKKKPKVTGTKRVGKKLKVSKGTWSLKGVKVSFQWLRNGKKISKATKRTYKLKKKDLGKRISVRVTVKKAGYKNAKFVTKKTSKIKAKKKR